MVSSKMDGGDPHFDAKSIATHNKSWDLEKVDVQADPTAESGKAATAGRDERGLRPAAAPGYWRQHVHKESARNTGSPIA
jgi:hypothetical protein